MKILKRGCLLILECLVAVEVLVCIGELPILFDRLNFHLKDYIEAVYQFTTRIYTFKPFYYHVFQIKVPLFPIILSKYLYSMEILILGIIAAGIIAFIIAYNTHLLFRKKMSIITKWIEAAESVPDLMYMFLLVMLIVWINKTAGVVVFKVVSLNEKAFVLPVISIALPVSFYMAKVIIFYIQEEMEKDYVTFAKSKGFSVFYILNRHVLQNIAGGLLVNSKTIIWSMLSSLIIIDHLYNMIGLMDLMSQETDPFIIGSILIFIPFFIFYRILEGRWGSN